MKEKQQNELVQLLQAKQELFRHKQATDVLTMNRYYEGMIAGIDLAITNILVYGGNK